MQVGDHALRTTFVQRHHLTEELVHLQRLYLQLARFRIVGKVVDHGLHRLDLLHDSVSRAIEHLRVFRRQLTQVFAAQALGRQLDRRQRILDLMCQAPRHLSPGGVTLRLEQLGDIVEYQHMPGCHAGVRLEWRVPAQQHLATNTTIQRDLRATLVHALLEALDHPIDERL